MTFRSLLVCPIFKELQEFQSHSPLGSVAQRQPQDECPCAELQSSFSCCQWGLALVNNPSPGRALWTSKTSIPLDIHVLVTDDFLRFAVLCSVGLFLRDWSIFIPFMQWKEIYMVPVKQWGKCWVIRILVQWVGYGTSKYSGVENGELLCSFLYVHKIPI